VSCTVSFVESSNLGQQSLFGRFAAWFGGGLWMSAGGLRCKRCGAGDYARSGVVCGHQRYRCRACGCHFTDTPARAASRLP